MHTSTLSKIFCFLIGITLFVNSSEVKAAEFTKEDNTNKYEQEYEYIPTYYQDDYDVEFGESSIKESGNLVTCLSMLESYYFQEDIEPSTFVKKHKKLCKDGAKSLNHKSMSYMSSYMKVAMVECEYDTKTALEYLTRYHANILLHIPHNSILGKESTYILLTGCTKDGFIIRDPSKRNHEKYSISSGNNVYSYYTISGAASKSSVMYIFY